MGVKQGEEFYLHGPPGPGVQEAMGVKQGEEFYHRGPPGPPGTGPPGIQEGMEAKQGEAEVEGDINNQDYPSYPYPGGNPSPGSKPNPGGRKK